MALLAICPERALTPLEEIRDAIIVVDGRRIVAVGRRGELRLPPGAQEYSAPGITVVPGFVDVHIHGAGGHDVMESTPEALGAVAASVARRGTTSLVATTVTASTEHICRAAQGIARYIAAQPERPPKTTPVAGLVVGLGHTDATYAQACAAIEKGARHAVHVFNAMRPFSHRETGVLGAVLTAANVSAELIADGVHV